MKNIIQKAALIAVVIGFVAIGAFGSAAGVIAEQRIGIVNLQKIFEKYYKTIRSQAALKEEAMELQKEREDMVNTGKQTDIEWQKLVDKSSNQALSNEEKARAKAAAEDKFREVKSEEEALHEYDRASATRLQEKQRQRHDAIVNEITNVVAGDAKLAGYTLVLDVSGESANTVPVVLYSTGANDLTDQVIRELNAGAPPPTDDKEAKSGSDKSSK